MLSCVEFIFYPMLNILRNLFCPGLGNTLRQLHRQILVLAGVYIGGKGAGAYAWGYSYVRKSLKREV